MQVMAVAEVQASRRKKENKANTQNREKKKKKVRKKGSFDCKDTHTGPEANPFGVDEESSSVADRVTISHPPALACGCKPLRHGPLLVSCWASQTCAISMPMRRCNFHLQSSFAISVCNSIQCTNLMQFTIRSIRFLMSIECMALGRKEHSPPEFPCVCVFECLSLFMMKGASAEQITLVKSLSWNEMICRLTPKLPPLGPSHGRSALIRPSATMQQCNKCDSVHVSRTVHTICEVVSGAPRDFMGGTLFRSGLPLYQNQKQRPSLFTALCTISFTVYYRTPQNFYVF